MILPSAEHVLRTVSAALETTLIPALTEKFEASPPETRQTDKLNLSTMLTVSHLIRHVGKRIDREGQDFYDEMPELEQVLRHAADYLGLLDNNSAAQAENDAIRALLAETWCGPRTYPSLRIVSERVGKLRQRLYLCLKLLQTLRADHGTEPAYRGIREEIRAYINHQLTREGEVVDTSYDGFGLRR